MDESDSMFSVKCRSLIFLPASSAVASANSCVKINQRTTEGIYVGGDLHTSWNCCSNVRNMILLTMPFLEMVLARDLAFSPASKADFQNESIPDSLALPHSAGASVMSWRFFGIYFKALLSVVLRCRKTSRVF